MASVVGGTLTTIDSILKDLYLPPVVEQLNNEVLLLQRLEARDQELVGKQAVVPLHKSRTSGIGARGESIQLPAPGNQAYARAVFDLKYLYGQFAVTGPSMVKSKNDSGAFLQILKGEVDGLRNDLRDDLARMVYGTGDGIIATVGATTNATTVTLASNEGIRKGWFYIGMKVDIGTLANPIVVNAAQAITGLDLANVQLTFAAAQNVTITTHKIFRAGNNAASSVTYETSGLQQIVPTAANTFGGIDASQVANAYWDNLRMGNAGTNRSLTLDLLQQAWSTARVAGASTSSLITSYGLQRAYFNLLQSQIRYVEPTRLAGGFESLDFMGKPLIADIDAPYNKIYFLDEQYLKVFADRDWHFLDEDGHVLKWNPDFDEWRGAMAKYMNLGASRRNTQLVLFDLTDAGV